MNALAHLTLLTILCSSDVPPSSALFQTLPPDGSWVTFNVLLKVDDREVSPTWTARSVGTATHEGKPCRFVELEQSMEKSTEMFGNVTWRLLIPEAEFGEGKHPFGHAIKVWVKYGENEAEAIPDIASRDLVFAALLRGPSSNLKREDAREKVSWQRGSLECDVVSGSYDFDFFGVKLDLHHRVIVHKDVPFGLAGMKQEIKGKFGAAERNAIIQTSLRDHGLSAKPTLPQLAP